ncbi:uncharacterized protein LOC108164561 [Drosophila miranda]|uniref:uncharacterized protein LOC108164561 n=1 Tax=Drosophila miranda TaxID=7229 RepID=UPI00143F5A2D|nr:uncharacterized protein LOC108164561 [Drosophila miranda]
MSSKKRLGARRQGTAAVPLNEYFCSDEEPQNTSNPVGSVGTITGSNEFSHTSIVTPILTPTSQDNDQKPSNSTSVAATLPAFDWDSDDIEGAPNKAEQAPSLTVQTSENACEHPLSIVGAKMRAPLANEDAYWHDPALPLKPDKLESIAKWLSSLPTKIQSTWQQLEQPEALDQGRALLDHPLNDADADAFSLSASENTNTGTAIHDWGIGPQAQEAEATQRARMNFTRRPRRKIGSIAAKDLMKMENPMPQPQPLPYNYYCSAPAPQAPAPSTYSAPGPNPIILSAIPSFAPEALALNPGLLPIEVLLVPERIDIPKNVITSQVVYRPQTGEILAREDRLPPQPPAPMENCHPMLNQSVFRLASLPITGVGTGTDHAVATTTQLDGFGLPSSISGPSQELPSLSSWYHKESNPSYIFASQETEVVSLCQNSDIYRCPMSSLYQNQEQNITSMSNLLQQDFMDNKHAMDNLKTDHDIGQHTHQILDTNNAQSPLGNSTRAQGWEEGWNLSQGDLARDIMHSRPLLNMDLEDNNQQAIGIDIEIDKEDPDTHGTVHSAIKSLPTAAPPGQSSSSTVARHQLFSRRPANEAHPKPDLNFAPSSVKKLYQLICSQYSDYAFIYALSAQLSQECVPMDCYVYLKMVLLASIASIEPDELRSPISLCIIATDSTMANRLMSSVGQLAPRFLGPHEGGLQATHSALPVRYNWVVASPLLMAQQGVYYVGDWTRLSREHGEQLEKAIENGAVPVPQTQGEQPLETAIWTHWQPENATNQTVAFAKLCPIFGLPIYMGEKVSDSLWGFLLQLHSEDGQKTEQDGLNVPEEDLRMLLGLLHKRKVVFGDAAQFLLQKYYVISRKQRPTVFSSKTYIVLKQFAESFAKLAMRLEVLEADVIVAIFHCEHFVQKIFGAQEMPAPSMETFSVISHIDPYMDEFTRWLLNYLDRYGEEQLGIQVKRRSTGSWDQME